jgi:MHS family proline/betaine transporter-like MFS transporter
MILNDRARTIIAGAVGNVLEWYDFALFGYFAPIISEQFFPSTHRLTALLNTYGIFALGFFMRPLGGLIFGHIGDKVGRKQALLISVLLMAIPTALIGMVPTYEQIGMAAPLLLTVIRLLQGISVGGEYIGSMSFLVEHAPPGQRGFIGSWCSVSAGSGILIGSGAAAAVDGLVAGGILPAWGWRLAFMGGIVGGIIGLWLRAGIEESPCFKEAAAEGDVVRAPVLLALRKYYGAILTTVGLTLMMSIGFYLPWVFLATWLSSINKPALSMAEALTINTICMAITVTLTPLAGALSDRIGRKTMLAAGATGFLLLTVPLFLLLRHGTIAAALTAQLVFGLISVLLWGTSPAAFVELFPTRTRYSGVAIGYNATQAVFGGTTPLVATWLIDVTGYTLAPAFYLTAAAAITLAVILSMRERGGEPLH